MPLADRLIHSLAIVTPVTDGTLDDDGDAMAGEPTVEPVRGLVEPKSAQEIADSRSAGAELSDHAIYMLIREEPASGAWISDNPDDVSVGRRYDITGVEARRYGSTPHLKILARLVRSTEVVVAAGS